MGGFIQPKVTPLPAGIDLTGKTIIITGATAGLGLESARQLLALKAATVILAVRNTAKGETCKTSLLADPLIQKLNPTPVVKVMKLDVDDYASVTSFAAAVKAEVPVVDFLLLNAGIAVVKFERSASGGGGGEGHERTVQVNYLSNVLLLLALLPYLEASAAKTGSPTRITWIGSRRHGKCSLTDNDEAKTIQRNETVLGHMDDPKYFFPFQRYGDSKLLCVLFLYEVQSRLDRSKVVLNMMCPGMVDTSLSAVLPFYLRAPVSMIKAMRARKVEEGTWLVLNALCVVGDESHGQFIADKDVMPHVPFVDSAAGQDLQKRLYEETIAEMQKYVQVPEAWMMKA